MKNLLITCIFSFVGFITIAQTTSTELGEVSVRFGNNGCSGSAEKVKQELAKEGWKITPGSGLIVRHQAQWADLGDTSECMMFYYNVLDKSAADSIAVRIQAITKCPVPTVYEAHTDRNGGTPPYQRVRFVIYLGWTPWLAEQMVQK